MSDLFGSKTMELLKKLDKNELLRLQDFIESPYYNKSRKVVALYNILMDSIISENESVTSTTIFKQVKEINNEPELAKCMNVILNLAYRFLYLECRQDHFIEDIEVVNEVKKRDLPKHYRFLLKRLKEDLKKEPKSSVQYFFHKHLLAESVAEGFEKKGQRSKDNLITPVIDTLDEFYFSKRLVYLCEALNRAGIIDHPVEDKMYGLTDQFLEANNTSPDNFFLFIYERVYKMFREEDSKESKVAYNEIKSFLSCPDKEIDPKVARIVSTYLLNFCTIKINEGDDLFLREYFEVIKIKDQQGLLSENGKLSQHRFKNVVTTGLRLYEFEWVSAFVEQYGKFLPKEKEEDYTNYAWGYYYYAKGEYNKAGGYLAKAKHVKDVFFGIAVRKLVLKNLYESGNNDVDHDIESMRKFLERNKEILGDQWEGLQQFVRYFKRFWKWKQEKEKLLKLLQQLDNEHFIERDWRVAQMKRAVEKAF